MSQIAMILMASLVLGTSASATGLFPANAEPISRIYQWKLGRNVDPTTLAELSLRIGSGDLTLQQLEQSIEASSEYISRGGITGENVTNLFRMLMARQPTMSELLNLVAMVNYGCTLNQIAQLLRPPATSGFTTISKATAVVPPPIDMTPLMQIFENIQNREISVIDRTAYSAQLTTGHMGLHQAVSSLRVSSEYLAHGGASGEALGNLYQLLLNRMPDPPGWMSWLNVFLQDHFLWKISQTFQMSPEFFAGHPGLMSICSGLSAYNGTGIDATAALQACLNVAVDYGTVFIPVGSYTMNGQAIMSRPVHLSTLGKSYFDLPCDIANTRGCAELKASSILNVSGGLVVLSAANSSMDHLVFNGNRSMRLSSQAASDCHINNSFGFNLMASADHLSFTNNVSKWALCGSGGVLNGYELQVSGNSIYQNGDHIQDMLWSDGLTISDSHDSSFVGNYFEGNTDIDFIFGGCARCKIQNNQIFHESGSNATHHGSFGSLMIQNWPGTTTGDYTNADVSANQIDCGTNKSCGFGLLIGGDPWYNSFVGGGSFHDNSITNAEQGFDVEHSTNSIEVYNNIVTSSGGVFHSTCSANETASAYNISNNSVVDRSRDTIPTSQYTHVHHCILNYLL